MTTLWTRNLKKKIMDDIFKDIDEIAEQSDISLGDDFNFETPEPNQNNSLQRNDDWDALRCGSWNASEVKGLLSCNQKFSKISWHNKEKHLAFSDGSIKYIFKKAKERQTKRTIKNNPTNAMKYGTIIEDFTFRRSAEILKKEGLVMEKVGYKSFDSVPNAGASSDAVIKEIISGLIVASGEMKACVSWETFYDRTFENCDEKSIDFWQTQHQMLAWDVAKTYYIVISPPRDINKYIYSDDLESLYDYWVSETEIELQVVEKSDLHSEAILKRIEIAEKVISEYIETKGNIKEILHRIVDEEKGIIRIDNTEEIENVSRETLDDLSEFEKAILEQTKGEPITEKTEEKQVESVDDLDDDLPF